MAGILRAIFFSAVMTAGVVLLSACSGWTVNTLPPLLSPKEPAQHVSLVVPDYLEVKSVDFDMALFTDAADGTSTIPWEVGGRAFIEVEAVHKETGERYLLLYEDVAKRQSPVQIIRFGDARATGSSGAVEQP